MQPSFDPQYQKVQGGKYLWQIPRLETQRLLEVAARYNILPALAQTILLRGHATSDQIESYLFTSDATVTHPSLLKDAQKAVDRIISAINNKEKILIAGDYDVDGITSSALMMICLIPLGAQVNFFLPHRVKDGYGLSVKVVEQAARNNYKVLVTVDNGITAFEPAKKAKELGIDLIITDHHRTHGSVPEAFAVVNPNQDDCPYPYKKFAGVGVIFKVLTLLYEKMGIAQLPTKAYELLLLGTIADVVPLTEENRYWVRHGLRYINQHESTSLKVLKQNGKLSKSEITATDIGFCLTPQINALGRLEDARQGVKFLIGSNEDETAYVGRILFELNEARKNIERSIFQEIVASIQDKKIDLDKENIIMAASDQWPPGVIGLVASRLVGAYGKPALLFHTNKNIAKGSCRSIPEFNMFDALSNVRDLLIQFGGHSVAAGLSLSKENMPALKAYLEERIASLLTPEDLKRKLTVDAEISLSDVGHKIVHDLKLLSPFGNGNPEPVFYIKNVSLVQQPQLLKDAHVKCLIFAEGVIKPVIFFNNPELFKKLLEHGDKSFDLAVQITENHWNDKVSIELLGIDIAL